MLADKFILSLENVELNRKHLLPDCSGIYYVIDLEKTIWYIGRSIDLNRRWNGEKTHHRYEQLLSLAVAKKMTFLIYYNRINLKKINREEKKSIAFYQPLLNNTPIDKAVTRSRRQNNSVLNSSLKILSDFTIFPDSQKLEQDARFFIEDNLNMET